MLEFGTWCNEVKRKRRSAKHANKTAIARAQRCEFKPKVKGEDTSLYRKGNSQESVTARSQTGRISSSARPKGEALTAVRDVSYVLECCPRTAAMKEACRQRRRIKVRHSVVRHASHGQVGGRVCEEGPADVMEAREFAVWNKAWKRWMLAYIRLMPCAAMQAPVCQLPPYRCHALRHAGLLVNYGLDLAHGCGSERMFEPIWAL